MSPWLQIPWVTIQLAVYSCFKLTFFNTKNVGDLAAKNELGNAFLSLYLIPNNCKSILSSVYLNDICFLMKSTNHCQIFAIQSLAGVKCCHLEAYKVSGEVFRPLCTEMSLF
jgi:hypothetical protein